MNKKLFYFNMYILQSSLILIEINKQKQLVFTLEIPYIIRFNINLNVEIVTLSTRLFNVVELVFGIGS